MSFCVRCGSSFGCAMMGEMEGPCWCTQLPPALPVPSQQGGCLCPHCLRLQIESLPSPPSPPA